MTRVISTIGASQHYGPFTTDTGLPNGISDYGNRKTVELAFDWTQANAGLPVYNGEDDSSVISLPKEAYIVDARFKVSDEAFDDVGNTAVLTIGLSQADGDVVDANGIGEAAVATLTANAWIDFAGALIGAVSDSEVTQVTVSVASESFTQGRGKMILTYIDPYVA